MLADGFWAEKKIVKDFPALRLAAYKSGVGWLVYIYKCLVLAQSFVVTLICVCVRLCVSACVGGGGGVLLVWYTLHNIN